MKRKHSMLKFAGAMALAVACVSTGAEVRTRVYEEPKPAAVDRDVVTRDIEDAALPPEEGVTPFAFGIVPGVSLPPENWSVVGLRINLFAGRQRNLWGIDAGGLGNILDGSLTGIQGAGLWNQVGEAPAALQSAGIANLCERDFCGIQTAGIYNWTGEEFMGLQVGLLNRVGGLTGLQVGLYNGADHGCGLQIGLINVARALEGVQIGLANVNEQSPLEFFPVMNMAF